LAYNWGMARYKALRFEYRESADRLKKAIEQAKIANAPPELLGIMHHDLASAHVAGGDFKAACTQCDNSEMEYSKLEPPASDALNVKVGLIRAKSTRLQMAVWQGASKETCEESFSADIRKDIEKVGDHYSLWKGYLMLGYLGLMDDDLEYAHSNAKNALAHAPIAQWKPDHYWFIRDGGFLGYGWCVPHAQALMADLVALQHSRIETTNWSDRFEVEFIWRRWARRVPPLLPFYAWKLELLANRRAATVVEKVSADCIKQMKQMEKWGYIMYLPLSMVAYGDFSREVEDKAKSAASWYQRAQQLATKHGLGRLERLAQRRIQGVQ
jgi:hypothetical protein